MLNIIRKNVILVKVVRCVYPKTRVGFLFNGNMFFKFNNINVMGSSFVEIKTTPAILITNHLMCCVNKYKLYLYILGEYIFDRRFIYSILFLRQNKARCRRTKRFVFQSFSNFFLKTSLVGYMKKYSITAKLNIAVLLLLAEYFNIIWFLFFYRDWFSAKVKRVKLPSRGKKKFQKWLFNLNYIKKKKPISYIKKKLKKNKKKPIVLKNHFNVGFGYSYIGRNYRFLLTRRGVV